MTQPPTPLPLAELPMPGAQRPPTPGPAPSPGVQLPRPGSVTPPPSHW